MPAKKNRVQKKAEHAISVGGACLRKCEVDIYSLRVERNDFIASIDGLKARIRATSDPILQETLMSEIEDIEFELEQNARSIEDAENLAKLLRRLISLLKTFYRKQQYRYITKKMPYKKLPKLIQDPNKIEQVSKTINRLYQEFVDQANILGIIIVDNDESIARTTIEGDTVRKMSGADRPKTRRSERVAEILNEGKNEASESADVVVEEIDDNDDNNDDDRKNYN